MHIIFLELPISFTYVYYKIQQTGFIEGNYVHCCSLVPVLNLACLELILRLSASTVLYSSLGIVAISKMQNAKGHLKSCSQFPTKII